MKKADLEPLQAAAEKLSFLSHSNPPFLSWPRVPEAQGYLLEISASPEFSTQNLYRKELSRNFHTPEQIFEPGLWYYRIGVDGEYSPTYTVEIPEKSTRFVLPLERTKISEHPRVYLRAEDITRLRTEIDGPKKPIWEQIQQKADEYLGEPLPEEPPRWIPLPDGSLEINGWRRLFVLGGQIQEILHTLTFTYLMTQNKRYSNRVIEWVHHLSSWEIPGSTADPAHCDHTARDIMHSLSLVYDWLHDELDEATRSELREVLRRRAEVMYGFLNPYYGFGWNNHPWFNTSSLSIASAALAGDVPQAMEWLDFTYQLFLGRFLCLGESQGEWHEGAGYWYYAVVHGLEAAEAVRAVTGTDLYQHPWLRQTGRFPLYAQPSFGIEAEFGDLHFTGPNSGTLKTMMKLTSATRDSYTQWYIQQALSRMTPSIFNFIWYDLSVPAIEPTELPQSIHYKDIGWAILHNSLSSPDDILFTMKSGHYFASGHEHADQNAFSLGAFGERLAIASGHYDWYWSPHHSSWTVRTRASNSILVDGNEQACFMGGDQDGANGSITEYFDLNGYAYVAGDASNPRIYLGKLSRFQRHVLKIHPDLFIMIDDLAADHPAKWEWLLHCLEEPTTEAEKNRILIERGKAQLEVRFAAPSSIQIESKCGYPIPPEKREGKEWHLSVSPEKLSAQERFISVLHPALKGAKSMEVTPLGGDNWAGALIHADKTCAGAVWLNDSGERKIVIERLEGNGKSLAVCYEPEKSGLESISSLFQSHGTQLMLNQEIIYRSDSTTNMSLIYQEDRACLNVSQEKPGLVQMRLLKQPASIKQKDGTAISWTVDRQLITLNLPSGTSQITIHW